MKVIARLETGLRAAVVLLALGLAAAITTGVLLRQPPPVGYAATEGRPLLQRSGSGPVAATAVVRFRQHAIGIGVRCDGHGTLRVDLHPFGAVETPCSSRAASHGGFVLSDIPLSTTRWQVQTRPGNRWSLVLTQPIGDGTTWTP